MFNVIKFNDEFFFLLYSSPNIVSLVLSRTMRRSRRTHGCRRNSNRTLVRKSEAKESLYRPRNRRKNGIKIYYK